MFNVTIDQSFNVKPVYEVRYKDGSRSRFDQLSENNLIQLAYDHSIGRRFSAWLVNIGNQEVYPPDYIWQVPIVIDITQYG